MGVYKKCMTIDCPACNYFKSYNGKISCMWGKTVKILVPQKGNKPLNCKLKRKGEL